MSWFTSSRLALNILYDLLSPDGANFPIVRGEAWRSGIPAGHIPKPRIRTWTDAGVSAHAHLWSSLLGPSRKHLSHRSLRAPTTVCWCYWERPPSYFCLRVDWEPNTYFYPASTLDKPRHGTYPSKQSSVARLRAVFMPICAAMHFTRHKLQRTPATELQPRRNWQHLGSDKKMSDPSRG